MGDVFRLTMPAWELLLRGTVMYWFLFMIIRFVLRRDAGSVGLGDFLFVIIVADASQNAMIGQGTSLFDGMLLVSTLVGWNYLFDWLSYRSDAFRRFVDPEAIVLVRNGRCVRAALRREYITRQELEGKMRGAGIANLADVRKATLESDGNITFIGKRAS